MTGDFNNTQQQAVQANLTDISVSEASNIQPNISQPNNSEPTSPDLANIMSSANRLGIELDEAEALQWLTAIAAASEEEIIEDFDSGVFGHRVAMLDFSPEELTRFRRIGKLVEFEDEEGIVETALALSGSAAQSKVQTYPGDCDYFERVNIITKTRGQACEKLAQIIKDKALSTSSGESYELLEVKFGEYPQDATHNGQLVTHGAPISWRSSDIERGYICLEDESGQALKVHWEDVQYNPGWCKLDWVIVDAKRKELTCASNMLDVTWESPEGTIVPLDGYLDGYFQEVYLEAESVPIFSKLVKHVSTDVLDDYVGQLELEVAKYVATDQANYGKAAKRMYNIFRMTGRYNEAAYLRELFDEPAALLYQVYSLMRTVEDAVDNAQNISVDDLLEQTDELIMTVIKVLEGTEELEIVRHLLKLEHAICRHVMGREWRAEVDVARKQVLNIVNNFFYSKMQAIPQIKAYMEACV